MFLAGIQENTLDSGLRRYEPEDLNTHLCGVELGNDPLDDPRRENAECWDARQSNLKRRGDSLAPGADVGKICPCKVHSLLFAVAPET
jgi:hypothetical protein